jgi:hypothetical protein
MWNLPLLVRVAGPMVLLGMALGLVVPLGEGAARQPFDAAQGSWAPGRAATTLSGSARALRPGATAPRVRGDAGASREGGPPVGAARPDIPDCPASGTPADGSSAARVGAWWRLDPVLDAAGWLVGQELRVGRFDGDRRARLWRTLSLPPESFASGPTRGRVLVGSDDGEASRLVIVDLARGCLSIVAEVDDVVRRAVLAPDGTTAFEFRVRRGSREDLGVWRRDLGATNEAHPLLGAPPADAAFGPTWTTELVVDADGGRIAVESCGDGACRHRVLDLASGEVTLYSAPEAGQLVGLGSAAIYVRAACPGLPCPILELRPDREPRVVVPSAGLATLLAGPAGGRLVAETPDGTRAEVIDPLDGRVLAAIALEPGHRIVAAPGMAMSGLEVLDGAAEGGPRVVTAPEGRIDEDAHIRLVDPRRAVAIDLEEVLP